MAVALYFGADAVQLGTVSCWVLNVLHDNFKASLKAKDIDAVITDELQGTLYVQCNKLTKSTHKLKKKKLVKKIQISERLDDIDVEPLRS